MGRRGAVGYDASAPTWSSNPVCAIPSRRGPASRDSARRIRVRERPTTRALHLLCRQHQTARRSSIRPGSAESLSRTNYSTLFALLAYTGLRVSEAIKLRFEDVTADGLIIRCSKFRKRLMVPLHSTAQIGLERYIQRRRLFAPFDDHVFVSLRRRSLLVGDAETHSEQRQ
jgi:integrase/recombinase XerD